MVEDTPSDEQVEETRKINKEVAEQVFDTKFGDQLKNLVADFDDDVLA